MLFARIISKLTLNDIVCCSDKKSASFKPLYANELVRLVYKNNEPGVLMVNMSRDMRFPTM